MSFTICTTLLYSLAVFFNLQLIRLPVSQLAMQSCERLVQTFVALGNEVVSSYSRIYAISHASYPLAMVDRCRHVIAYG